jgi:hypothetical protein
VIDTDPGRDVQLLGIALPLPQVRVIRGSCSDFVRARWPSWSERPGSVPACFRRCSSFAEPYACARTITRSAVFSIAILGLVIARAVNVFTWQSPARHPHPCGAILAALVSV